MALKDAALDAKVQFGFGQQIEFDRPGIIRSVNSYWVMKAVELRKL